MYAAPSPNISLLVKDGYITMQRVKFYTKNNGNLRKRKRKTENKRKKREKEIKKEEKEYLRRL